MAVDHKEEHLFELVTWLERAGHEADARSHFARFCTGRKSSCRQVGYDVTRVETDGIFEVHFLFPFAELEKACRFDDEEHLAKWLDCISTDGISAEVIEEKGMGKCVLVRRLHHIPTDLRREFFDLEALPDEDFWMLSRLLHQRVSETNDG